MLGCVVSWSRGTWCETTWCEQYCYYSCCHCCCCCNWWRFIPWRHSWHHWSAVTDDVRQMSPSSVWRKWRHLPSLNLWWSVPAHYSILALFHRGGNILCSRKMLLYFFICLQLTLSSALVYFYLSVEENADCMHRETSNGSNSSHRRRITWSFHHSIFAELAVGDQQTRHTYRDRQRQTDRSTSDIYSNSPLLPQHFVAVIWLTYICTNNGSHRFRLGWTETSCSIVLVKSTGLQNVMVCPSIITEPCMCNLNR